MSKMTYIILAAFLTGTSSFAQAAIADTTTTVQTTTYATGVSYTLPAGGTYVVIDPISGDVKGVYDPATRLLNGQPLPIGYVVSDKTTGRVLAVVDSSGHLVDVATAPATTVLISAIEARRAEIEKQIADALAKGIITPEQAAPIRAELTRVNTVYTTATSNGTITFAQAFPLAYQLNALSSRVIPLTHATFVAPVVSQRFIVVDNKILFADDVTFRKAQLEQSIDDNYNAGRLSQRQVGDLKGQLNEIASMTTRYTKHGAISDSNRRRIDKRFDIVKADLDRDIGKINEKRAKIGIRVN
jgi:hypothetical protein